MRAESIIKRTVLFFDRFTYLNALRNGMVAAIPIIMIGSFSILLLNLPVTPYQNFIQNSIGGGIHFLLETLITCTMNFLVLYLLITISQSYERLLNLQPQGILPLLSLCVYITFSMNYAEGFSVIIFDKTRLIDCILIIFLASQVYLRIIRIRYFRIFLYSEGADTVFNASMSAILPITVITCIFAFIKIGFWKFAGITDLNSFSMEFLSRFFIGEERSLGSLLKFVFLVHAFWFFGIHGSNLLENIAHTLFAPTLSHGAAAGMNASAHEVITKSFIDGFVLLGGAGTTLCLVLALIIIDKRRNIRSLASLASSQILFNINEIIIYGLPIVLNMMMLIPFILVPLTVTLISYVAFRLGLVPPPIYHIEWTTPIFLSGFIATASIRGAILQGVNLIAGILIYAPFVKLNKRHYYDSVKQNIDKLTSIVKTAETDGIPPELRTLTGSLGSVYRMLTSELMSDLKNRKLELNYQPQVNYYGRVIGFEALLRWRVKDYGLIYPPLTIVLAEEANIMAELGDFITDQACSDIEKIADISHEDLCVSINFSASQISDPKLKTRVENILARHSLGGINLGIEITEQSFLASSELVRFQLESLKNLGIHIKLDDFGMGHSSLLYLQNNHFDEIKLDGSLVRELTENPRCSNIIASIVHLSQSLGFIVLAEFVDTEKQRQILHELGCDCYQGYYYSPALPLEEAIEYFKAMNTGTDGSAAVSDSPESNEVSGPLSRK